MLEVDIDKVRGTVNKDCGNAPALEDGMTLGCQFQTVIAGFQLINGGECTRLGVLAKMGFARGNLSSLCFQTGMALGEVGTTYIRADVAVCVELSNALKAHMAKPLVHLEGAALLGSEAASCGFRREYIGCGCSC